MDCKTAKEKINMFDFLLQEEKDEVLAHAQSCKECRNELINSAKLREALAEFGELEPPAGLAQSAIRKARKTVKIPPFAYISVAVAAVVAVAFFATSSILSPGMNNADDAVQMQMASDEQLSKSTGEAMDFGAGVDAAEMAEESMVADAYMAEDDGIENSADDATLSNDSDVHCIIYVPADKAEFAAAVDEFLAEKDIYKDSYRMDADTQVIMFVVGELNLEEFKALLLEYEMNCDSDISAGTLVEMTIES